MRQFGNEIMIDYYSTELLGSVRFSTGSSGRDVIKVNIDVYLVAPNQNKAQSTYKYEVTFK